MLLTVIQETLSASFLLSSALFNHATTDYNDASDGGEEYQCTTNEDLI